MVERERDATLREARGGCIVGGRRPAGRKGDQHARQEAAGVRRSGPEGANDQGLRGEDAAEELEDPLSGAAIRAAELCGVGRDLAREAVVVRAGKGDAAVAER